MSEQQMIPVWQKAIADSRRKFEDINIANLVNYDKEAMFALQVIQKNDYLMKIANNNPETLRNAVINIAAIGLSLNPAEKLAYLIPRKGDVCLDVSYMGLIRLATDTGSVLWARAELVHANDEFIWHGATKEPEFSSPNPFNAGEVVGVYCVAKTLEGDYLADKMSLDECHEIRNRSEAYKHNQSGSWATDEGEMMKKTVLKRGSKTWPKSDKTARMDDAIEIINQHEGIDFSGQISPEAIDHQRVEEAYMEVVEIITNDTGEDSDYARAQELFYSLTQDEQLALNGKLQKYKPAGSRQYNTLFKEYLSFTPDADNLISARAE